MQTRWSLAESRKLVELYRDNKPNFEIAKFLNRTKRSVAARLHRLGLSRHLGVNQVSFGMDNPMKGKRHSDDTLKKLSEKARERLKDKTKHPMWKGGKRRNHNGYICIRNGNHPRSVNGYVFEHILVMEKMIGRELGQGEVIHHINSQRDDNRPENLMLFQNSADHNRYHAFMARKEVVGL